MYVLLIILIVIASIVAVFLLFALVAKKDYEVRRSVTINKPTPEVFNYVILLKNQDHYNKWWNMDPNAVKEFKGTDGTVGFIAGWDSQMKQAGKGEQEIKKITPNQQLDTELRFERPFKNVSQIYMTTEKITETQTKVDWVFTGKNKFPLNAMNGMIVKMLGKDLEISINDLKKTLEN